MQPGGSVKASHAHWRINHEQFAFQFTKLKPRTEFFACPDDSDNSWAAQLDSKK